MSMEHDGTKMVLVVADMEFDDDLCCNREMTHGFDTYDEAMEWVNEEVVGNTDRYTGGYVIYQVAGVIAVVEGEDD